MVFEHQAEAQNLIARAGYLTRIALHQEDVLNRELGQPAGHRWESTTRRIRSAAEPLAKYLLFGEEAPLTAEIRGSSGFAQGFQTRGRRDRQGRSLRDFDLKTRMFRYPCSYLIESRMFAALPAEVRDQILDRIDQVLRGNDGSPEFAHLTSEDRTAVREILIDTCPDLTRAWSRTEGSSKSARSEEAR